VRYYDTSALVKQYLQEAGSKLVLELLKSGEKVYTVSLTYAETHAAFSRRTREGPHVGGGTAAIP
jgi:predicted nucleic acid-binding protein